MKYIFELSKAEKEQLRRVLRSQVATETKLVCMIADNYKVDRNETLDLYMYLQKSIAKNKT